MAIIKTDTFAVLAGEPRASINNINATPAFAAIPPAGDAIYFMGKAYDPQSFTYLQSVKSPSMESAIINFAPMDHGLLSAKPGAFSPLGNAATSMANTGVYAMGHGRQQQFVLDNDVRHSAGTLYPFEDLAGQKHMVYATNEYSTTAGTPLAFGVTPLYLTCKLTIVEGDSLQSTRSYSKYLAQTGWVNGTTYVGSNFHPLYVSAADKCIYGITYQAYYLNTAGVQNADTFMTPCYVPFTTSGVDGTLSLGEITQMAGVPLVCVGTNRTLIGGSVQHWHFLGLDGSGDSVWLGIAENDTTTPNQFGTGYDGNWANGSYWNKTTYLQRMMIIKYNKSSNVTTVLLSVSGTTNWSEGSGSNTIANNYSHNPGYTAFIPSNIAGENNVFYSYLPVADTTDALNFLVIKWDKSSDTFDIRPATITMPVGETTENYYLHPTKRNSVNLIASPRAVATIATTGSHYLSIYTEHYADANISATATYSSVLCFAIDDADPYALSYHSNLAGFECLHSFTSDTNGRKISAICAGAARVLTFDTVGGWSIAGSVNGSYLALTHDASGNLWGVSLGDPNLYAPAVGATSYVTGGITESFVTANLELLTEGLTSRVSCVFEDSAISYNGTPITKNVIVNAYDTAGNRIATQVELKISSAVATFTTNGLTALTLTTLDSADTSVSLTITGAGLINISASFAVSTL